MQELFEAVARVGALLVVYHTDLMPGHIL